jgi:hypothetical protein
VIYAADRGALDAQLMARDPGRRAYLLRSQYEPGDALFHPTGGLVAEHGSTGRTARLTMRADPLAELPFQRVFVSLAGSTRSVAVEPNPAGSVSAGWEMSVGRGPTAHLGRATIVLPAHGAGTLVVGIEGSNDAVYAAPSIVETRIPYVTSDGRLTVLAPGLGWKLVQFTRSSVWLPSDVNHDLGVAVTKDRTVGSNAVDSPSIRT